MLLKTAAALMCIFLVGPPTNEFSPDNRMIEWLKKGHCHADYTSLQPLQKGHTKYPIVKISEKFSEGV
jgi:hypothetical protein